MYSKFFVILSNRSLNEPGKVDHSLQLNIPDKELIGEGGKESNQILFSGGGHLKIFCPGSP